MFEGSSYDPHKYAMDYHGMGYRECAAEVIRYLERIEGLDMQNPLRLRLTNHLQCCAAQRELATKQNPSPSWSYAPSQAYPHLNSLPPPASPGNHSQPPPIGIHHQQPAGPHHPQHVHHDLAPTYDISTSCSQTSSSVVEPLPRLAPVTAVLTPLTTTTSAALGYSPHQYPLNSSFTIPTSSHHHQNNYSQNNPSSQGMKPYRPWGAEVAY